MKKLINALGWKEYKLILKLISKDLDIIVENDFNPDLVIDFCVACVQKGAIIGSCLTAIGTLTVITITNAKEKKNELTKSNAVSRTA